MHPMNKSKLPEYAAIAVSEAEDVQGVDGSSWVQANLVTDNNEEIVPVAVPASAEEIFDADDGRNTSKSQYRDVPFAIGFLVHLFIMLIVAIFYGTFDLTYLSDGEDSPETTTTPDMTMNLWSFISYIVIPCGVASFFITNFITAFFLPLFAEETVRLCLIGSIPYSIFVAIILLAYYPTWWMLIVAALLVCVSFYYVYLFWRFIPFAASNLKMACKGISQNWSIYLVSIVLSNLGNLWLIWWFYVANGLNKRNPLKNPQYFDDDENDAEVDTAQFTFGFFLILSLYWTSTVLMNTSQTTVAGLMGTWCFDKESATSCCSTAVTASLYRSCTYSLGTICFGSLLNAIVSTLRYLANQTRNSENRDSILLCIIDCLLALLESIIEYFNEWAYVFAGIYGTSYLESGKCVLQLFEARGISSIVTDDLANYALNFVSLFTATCSGITGVLISSYFEDDYFFSVEGASPKSVFFWICFIVGFSLSLVMTNVVQGAMKTVIVCYADNPNLLLKNHPEEVTEMSEAWLKAFPRLSFFVAESVNV